jgi:PAS domain S-box-containing protein
MSDLVPHRAHARRLRRGLLVLVVAAALPLVVLVALLAWREASDARATLFRDLGEAQHLRSSALEELAGDVDTHIAVMRGYAEQRLEAEARVPAWQGPLDWPPAAVDPGPSGGIIAADPATVSEATRLEASALTGLFPLARATHASRPYLRWSYYFSDSRELVMIYPWISAAEMFGADDPRGGLAGFFAYDLYTMGLPEANPDRTAYWSPVYVDAGGQGLMVTHAAPVWVGDRFRGVVGTDVLLSAISTLLEAFPEVPATVAVIDQDGNLVAGTGAAATPDGPVAATTVLGSRDVGDTSGVFVGRGDELISSAAVPGTPWRLVMAVPEATVGAVVRQRLVPFGLVVGSILVSLIAGALILSRRFVSPAIAIADLAALPADEASAKGAPPGLPEAWRPLADRVLAAARAHTSQTAHLRAMVDGVPLRAAYVDADLVYRDANRQFLDFIGKSRDEVIGKPVMEILGEPVVATYRRVAPLIARGEIGRFEGWIPYVGHGERYLQVNIVGYQAPGDGRPGYMTFSRDQTDLKLAEREAEARLAELAEREGHYRSVVVSALDAIVVIDEAGEVVEYNPAAEASFGWTADEAKGRKIADLIVPPEARNAHTSGMERYLAGGAPHVIGNRIEVEGVRKDGSRLPLELTVTEGGRDGRRLFVSHLRDLTDSKKLEREMQANRERLHQVEKLSAMGSLLAGVAHELNNPLAIVVAQSTLLADKAPDAATGARAERIRAAAERCGRIVKSFLAMARQKPPQRVAVDVADVVRGSLEVVGYGLRSSGIEIDLRIPSGLPPVSADRDLLGQVFSNLLVNAQQALVTVPMPRLLRITAQADGGEVAVRILDNGPGVPDEVRDRIFDPYFTTKAVEVGTGIGLAISRSVVEEHGGAIRLVASELGGAGFEVRLPQAAVDVAGEAAGPSERRTAGLSVLIVDDERDVGESLAEMLEAMGHSAQVVDSGEAALDLLRATPVDALVTDLRMPGMDGAELARNAVALRPELTGRVLVMTGDTVAGPASVAARGHQGLTFLEKPFRGDDVIAAFAALRPRA